MAELKTITVIHQRLGRVHINEGDFDPAIHKREGEAPALKVAGKEPGDEAGKGKAKK